MNRLSLRSRPAFFALVTMCAFVIAPGGGGSGGGGSRGGGGFYDGGGHRSSNGGSDGITTAIIIVCLILVFCLVIFVASLGTNKREIVYAVLLLKNGPDYLEKLDSAVDKMSFASPGSRAIALKTVSRLIMPDDVIQGFVSIPDLEPSSDATCLYDESRDLHKQEMQKAGIENTDLKKVADLRRSEKLQHEASQSDAETFCVLGLITTVPATQLYSGNKKRWQQLINGRAVSNPRMATTHFICFTLPIPASS